MKVTINAILLCIILSSASAAADPVRDNEIRNSARTGIRVLYGMSDDPKSFYRAVSGCVIENNTIVDCGEAAILIGDAKGLDWTGKNGGKILAHPERYGNYVLQNTAPHGNRIVNNTITAQPGKAIIIDDAPDNRVENNRVSISEVSVR